MATAFLRMDAKMDARALTPLLAPPSQQGLPQSPLAHPPSRLLVNPFWVSRRALLVRTRHLLVFPRPMEAAVLPSVTLSVVIGPRAPAVPCTVIAETPLLTAVRDARTVLATRHPTSLHLLPALLLLRPSPELS
jgi:hypothetical protein